MKNPSKAFVLSAPAYISLFATLLTAGAAFVPTLAGLVNWVFPLIALVTAALLLWRSPPIYVGFMWWTWFLTPEVRRIVDYRIGYQEQSLVMLAPYLVMGIALVPIVLNLTNLAKPYRIPLAFTVFGLLYGYCIGLFNNSLPAATFDLLNWAVPVIGGAYVLTHWSYAPAFRQVTQRVFMWGLLVMGLYSIVQYFYLPAWDAYWMENAELTSIGSPVPQEVRVFSTLNSPGTFSNVVMAGLLLAFDQGGLLRVLGAAAGFTGFALSAVRSAWGGWLVGLLIMISRLPLRLRVRPIGILLVLLLIGVPLFTTGPVAELLSQRLSTFLDLENDTSFNDRLSLYTGFSSFTANNPLGQGLGSTGTASSIGNQEATFANLDSGIIAVIFTFGVLGTLYFVGGTLAILGQAFLEGRKKDVSSAAYIGITVAALAQLLFGNAWTGVAGTILWFFPCLLLASQHELSALETQPKIHVIKPQRPIGIFKI